MALKLRRKGVKRKGGPKRPNGIAFRTRLDGQSAVLMCERATDGVILTMGSMMAGVAMKVGLRLDKAGEKQLLDWLTMEQPK
jgi:hypothetical protein